MGATPPLGVHAPGRADLNLYAYVKGAVLQAVDPVGLDGNMLANGNPAIDPVATKALIAELWSAAKDFAKGFGDGAASQWLAGRPNIPGAVEDAAKIQQTPPKSFAEGAGRAAGIGFEAYGEHQAGNDGVRIGQRGSATFSGLLADGARKSAASGATTSLRATVGSAATGGAEESLAVDSLHSSLESGAEVFHGDGITRIGSDTVTKRVAGNVLPEAGFHDLVAHGSATERMFRIDGELTGSGQIAEGVASNPSFIRAPGPVRMVTCHGFHMAQDVANWLGVTVRAATTRVEVAQQPGSPATPADGGKWIDFAPEKGKKQ